MAFKKRDGTQIQLQILQRALIMGAVPIYSTIAGSDKPLAHSLCTNPRTLGEQLEFLENAGIIEVRKATLKGKEVNVVVLSEAVRQELANAMPFLSKLITTT
jgi:hypothetical protein